MSLKPEIFRQYDIRGVVGQDLTPETVEVLGKAIGTYFRNRNVSEVAVGRDCRLSSPEFFTHLSTGLRSTGLNVVELGTIPTPIMYFSIYHRNYGAGVMITGSHNPANYNGFKMMVGKDTLYGDSIQDIYKIVQSGDFHEESDGTISTDDLIPEYKSYVLDTIKLKKPLKVVVDAGNGTAGVLAVPIYEALGCEVIPLYCEMDGNFPNHHPDPTLPEALEKIIATVKETGADLGIAFDGDGDRIGVIDNLGEIIWGDKLMILLSRDILPGNPGAAVISEVKASKLLYDEIAKLGGRPIMWKTGHSLIKKKIKEEQAILAGEMSGHIFFADKFFGFDDATYAGARTLEILSRSTRRLNEILADLPITFNTPEIRIYASDKVKFQIVDDVRRELAKDYPIVDIDGVRATFPKGWALVRASNTQEVLVLRYEADTPEDLSAIQNEVENLIEKVIRKLER